MRYYTDSSSTVSLSFALITFYLVRETALTLCLKVYLDGAAKYFRPWRQRLWVKRRSKEGSKRGKKKKIRAQGFDMDCGGRLGSVVKGSQGRPVIGWHWNIAVDLCVCAPVWVCSQAVSEYCKAKYIAPARLHCFQSVDMLPSPCTRVNVDLKYNRH